MLSLDSGCVLIALTGELYPGKALAHSTQPVKVIQTPSLDDPSDTLTLTVDWLMAATNNGY